MGSKASAPFRTRPGGLDVNGEFWNLCRRRTTQPRSCVTRSAGRIRNLGAKPSQVQSLDLVPIFVSPTRSLR